MRKVLLSLAALATLSMGCGKPYLVVVAPQNSLKTFSKLKVDEFSIQRFSERMKGSPKADSYAIAANEANRSVMAHVSDALLQFAGTPGGPLLEVTAELDDFSTGSGAARGLAAFGLAPKHVGEGSISYFVTLKSNGKEVGSCKVITKITGSSEDAYAHMGRSIARFVMDYSN